MLRAGRIVRQGAKDPRVASRPPPPALPVACGESMRLGCALLIVLVLACLGGSVREKVPTVDPWPRSQQEAWPGYLVETKHVSILSTADPLITEKTAQSIERLLVAYQEVLGPQAFATGSAPKLRLRLYANRAQFKANGSRSHWVEGYYRDGVSYGYADPNNANPHHWILHEVVHQMSHRSTASSGRWLNEGLATYIASSRLLNDRLHLGDPDVSAYPVWWLSSWRFAGRWEDDEKAERIIPLRALITGQGGPSVDANFNAYYLGYWSLTHFLLHYEQGKYATSYRKLLASDGSLEDFERLVGPVDQIQPQWYAHVLSQAQKCQDAQVASMR